MSEQNYNSSSLTVLEGLDAVRKRPGMYIGSTSSRGLRHLVWEIADNSVDEALAGHGDSIVIKLHKDGSVEVSDGGRGIPVDIEKNTGLPGVVVVMTKLHAGGKFGGGSYKSSGGLHGVGASVVNALSERVDVTVCKGGKKYFIQFSYGVPGFFNAAGKFTPNSKLKVLGDAEGTGTSIRFWPDMNIFQPDAVIDLQEVLGRARQTAFLIPGVTVQVIDERGDELVDESFRYDGGTADFVDFLSSGAAVTDIITARGSGTYPESVRVVTDTGMTHKDIERVMEVDVAFRWGTTYEPNVKSFVNIVSTPGGGTHVAGFERALPKVINEYLRSMKVLKAAEENATKEDILEGLSAVVLVRIEEPEFEGQTKEILGTSAATRIVAQVVADSLKAWFDSPKNKKEAKAALEKIRAAANARRLARERREQARKRSKVESAAMPAKLRDCRSHDLEDSELFLIEGDSAGGSAVGARDSRTQAILPLRGKILNTRKANEKRMLDNAECVAIIRALGCGYGSNFDISGLRYGKLVIMADADPDGDHIRCLILTLCYTYLRPLLVAGRVYAAAPPLFQIIKNRGKDSEEKFFAQNESERDEIINGLLKKDGKLKREDIFVGRLKGLGEQDAEDLAVTTMEPGTRKLRKISLQEASEAAERIVEEAMGSDAAPRKRMIISESSALKGDELIDAS